MRDGLANPVLPLVKGSEMVKKLHVGALGRGFLRNGLLASASLAMLGAASTASAQATGENPPAKEAPQASAAANDPAYGEIVVTALKRESTIQTTPLSISATTGEALADAGVTDIRGLLQTTPSLSFVDGGAGQTRLVVRGIFSFGEPTVGLYYDEQPVAGAVGSNSDAGGSTPLGKLFDVERVEGLRGPQGTLYGASSMGGTLRVIYNKPTFETEGAVDADIAVTKGGDPSYGINAMVNLPLVTDKVALRLVGFNHKTGGYIDNIVLGQENVSPATARGGRAMLRIKPTDDLTIDGTLFYQRAFGDDPKWDGDAGPYNSTFRTKFPFDDKLTLYNLTANWDLGGANLTVVGSNMHRNVQNFGQEISSFFGARLNNDAACAANTPGSGGTCTPTQMAAFNDFVNTFIPSSIINYQKVRNPTAEIRLSSTGEGFLDWTIGAFYSRRTTDVDLQVQTADPVSGELNEDDVIFNRLIFDRLRQLAGFGEVSAHITDKLTVTFGARYYDYSRVVGGSLAVGNPFLGAPAPYAQSTSSTNGWVTKTNIAYQLTPRVLLYANASQGFRPGGVNQVVGLPEELKPYDSDSLWNYEAGVKTSWLDNRLIFNIDAFRIDWSDMQVIGRVPAGTFQFITNAGAARVQGIEADFSIRPVTGLTIDGNMTYSSAKLTEDQISSVVVGAGRKGDRIPYTPNFTFGASIQYNFPLSSTLEGMIRLDESYRGSSYSEFRPDNVFRNKLPAYSLTNLRLGVEGPDSAWGAYLYVNNITNETAINYSFAQALSGGKEYVTSAMPRTFGLNVRTRF